MAWAWHRRSSHWLSYKIKLPPQGYRLVDSVEDDVLVVWVLAIDQRQNRAAYRSTLSRLLASK